MQSNACHRYLIREWVRLSALLLCIFCHSAYAAQQVVDVRRIFYDANVSLTPYFDVLQDASNALTIEDLQNPAVAAQFKGSNTASEALNFGYTPATIWLRLQLSN